MCKVRFCLPLGYSLSLLGEDMSRRALQNLLGVALIDRDFCEELLTKRRLALLDEFGLTDEERELVISIKADSIQDFAEQLYGWLQSREDFKAVRSAYTISMKALSGEKNAHKTLFDLDIFLVESLALGILRAYEIKEPPVPIRRMIKIQSPLSIFKHLNLLELRLGLYDVAYRSLPNGSRVIVVDLNYPFTIQRTGVARELYVAFCRSPRAAELHWPDREQPNGCSDFFARCLMMPAAWVEWAYTADTSLESVAERFGVPIQIASQRLQELEY